jgi:hypothetical protein
MSQENNLIKDYTVMMQIKINYLYFYLWKMLFRVLIQKIS